MLWYEKLTKILFTFIVMKLLRSFFDPFYSALVLMLSFDVNDIIRLIVHYDNSLRKLCVTIKKKYTHRIHMYTYIHRAMIKKAAGCQQWWNIASKRRRRKENTYTVYCQKSCHRFVADDTLTQKRQYAAINKWTLQTEWIRIDLEIFVKSFMMMEWVNIL